MYVLAINGSHHTDEGNTGLVLNPFLDGIRDAGSGQEVDIAK